MASYLSFALDLPTTISNVNMNVATLANLANFSAAPLNENERGGFAFVYSAGSAFKKMRVYATHTYEPRTDTTNSSLKLTVPISYTNADGVVSMAEESCTIAWRHPGQYVPSASDMMSVISMTYRLIGGTLVTETGVPTAGVIQALDHGVLSELDL